MNIFSNVSVHKRCHYPQSPKIEYPKCHGTESPPTTHGFRKNPVSPTWEDLPGMPGAEPLAPCISDSGGLTGQVKEQQVDAGRTRAGHKISRARDKINVSGEIPNLCARKVKTGRRVWVLQP